MRGEKTPQISPNLASNSNILRHSLCGRKIENRKLALLAYMFTKFGGGRLNCDGDWRDRLYGGGKILRFFYIISRYIFVTVQDRAILAADADDY